ncbi:MAG: SNF2-related protein [Clostridia bacterium]
MRLIRALDTAYTSMYAVDMEAERFLFGTIFSNKEATLKSVCACINLGDKANIYDTEDIDAELDKMTPITYFRGEKAKYLVPLERIEKGKQTYYASLLIHDDLKDISGKYFIVWDDIKKALYNKLIGMFNLPLLEEWTEYLYQTLLNNGHLAKMEIWTDEDYDLSVNTSMINLDFKNIEVFRLHLGEQQLKSIISDGLSSGIINISTIDQKKLGVKDLDSYFSNYGHTAVSNLMNKIKPLSELVGRVNVIFKKKKLFPKQAMLVNGVVSLLNKSAYAIINAGMGCGKSFMAIASVEKYMQDIVRKKEPELSAGKLSKKTAYRAIIIAPGHLLKKWEREILDEVPLAKVQILTDISHVVKLAKMARTKPDGKYYYIISKDFCKLDYQKRPAVRKYTKKRINYVECAHCGDVSTTLYHFKTNGNVCPICKEINSEGKGTLIIKDAGYTMDGWICPSCGEILYPANKKSLKLDADYEGDRTFPLDISDFEGEKEVNSSCHNCGCALWEPNITNLGDNNKANPWVRISYWRNKSKKGTKTVWVHKKYLQHYILEKNLTEGEWSYVKQQMSRKIAPATYIKKNIPKNFFDFLICDEAQQYKAGGSAQANAFHVLCKASKKQLILTGTIMGGVAQDLFFTLFRLDSSRMLQRGFKYTDVIKFSEQYGVLETEYEFGNSDEYYNTSSKGRQMYTPVVRPGISPLLYSHFLLDTAVFMDLTDLAAFLPKFSEKTIRVEMSEKMRSVYHSTANCFKRLMRDKGGKKLISTMLQTLLAYPDKPFGFEEIRHPLTGTPIIHLPDLDKDTLYPKEEALINLINQEYWEENRMCVVYTAFTGEKGDKDTQPRLQEIIEKHCNLQGQVAILRSTTVNAYKREEWLKNASKKGIKVIICNPKLVETGLDLLDHPTLIFYSTGYSLFTLWQASRRAYRLNQKNKCLVYYLAYKGTLQDECLKLMAEKKCATAAIQGQFSSEGLAAMAQSVNPQVALASALSEGSSVIDDVMEAMFAKINETNNAAALSDEDRAFLEELEKDKDRISDVINNLDINMPILNTENTRQADSVSIFSWLKNIVISTNKLASEQDENIRPNKEEPSLVIIDSEEIKNKKSRKKVFEGQVALF